MLCRWWTLWSTATRMTSHPHRETSNRTTHSSATTTSWRSPILDRWSVGARTPSSKRKTKKVVRHRPTVDYLPNAEPPALLYESSDTSRIISLLGERPPAALKDLFWGGWVSGCVFTLIYASLVDCLGPWLLLPPSLVAVVLLMMKKKEVCPPHRLQTWWQSPGLGLLVV